MAEIRNYTMNFGSDMTLALCAKVSLRRNKPVRLRARRVVARQYDLLRPKVHG
ncbi:MAG: hypothetical protein ACREUW_19340 [Burkholderiales bacterium]